MNNTFNSFNPWEIFNNPVEDKNFNIFPKYKKLEIEYPSRINAMAIDPSKISWDDNTKLYSAWEVVFSIDHPISISVEISDESRIEWSREILIQHWYELFKNVTWCKESHVIRVNNHDELKHVGLWTSSRLISWVITALNHLYWKPLSPIEVIQLASQNHWEEMSNDNSKLKHVQSIWWSAASWQFAWWLQILAGNWQVIFNQDIDNDYKIMLWIPNDFKQKSAEELMKLEIDAMDWFIDCGKKYWPEIAYNILHVLMPASKEGKWDIVWDVILDYRKDKWSVKNCSFCYDWLEDLFDKLVPLKKDWLVDVISVSSVWPGIFALYKEKNWKEIEYKFKELDMNTRKFNINNDRYKTIIAEVIDDFWEQESTVHEFATKDPCKHIISWMLNYIAWRSLKTLEAVDIWFGWWRHLKYLNDNEINISWIDSSKAMVDFVEKKYWKLWNFHEWSILDIPFSDNSFDITVCTWVIHQAKTIEDYRLAISELSRITKSWGVLLMNVFTSDLIDIDLEKIWNTIWYLNKYWTVTWMISSDENIALLKEHWFESIDGSVIRESSDIWYASRWILRWSFLKH